MRFFLNSDPYFYCEPPNNWNLYSQQPNLSWPRPAQELKHSINYWRDLEGAKMEITLQKDLYNKNWPTTRIRPKANLPIYYGTGIERPNYNYKDTKTAKILKKLKDLRIEKTNKRVTKTARKLKNLEISKIEKAKTNDSKTARKLKNLENSKIKKLKNSDSKTARKLKKFEDSKIEKAKNSGPAKKLKRK